MSSGHSWKVQIHISSEAAQSDMLPMQWYILHFFFFFFFFLQRKRLCKNVVKWKMRPRCPYTLWVFIHSFILIHSVLVSPWTLQSVAVLVFLSFHWWWKMCFPCFICLFFWLNPMTFNGSCSPSFQRDLHQFRNNFLYFIFKMTNFR